MIIDGMPCSHLPPGQRKLDKVLHDHRMHWKFIKNFIKYVAARLIAVLIHQCVFRDKNVVHFLPA